MSDEDNYCRLCAEMKPKSKLLDIKADSSKRRKIVGKLECVKIEFTDTDALPQTVCLVCFENLERTWNFIRSVEKAQDTLKLIFKSRKGKSEIKIEKESDNEHFFDNDDAPSSDDEDSDRKPLKFEVNVDFEDKLLDCNIKSDVHDSDSSNAPLTRSQTRKQRTRRKKRTARAERSARSESSKSTLLAAKRVKPIDDPIELNRKWDDYIWRCYECKIDIKDLDSFRNHWQDIHKCCAVFKCIDCEKKSMTYVRFITHVRKHRRPLKYACDLCKAVFQTTAKVRKHRIEDHHPPNSNYCMNCGIFFETEDTFKEHMSTYGKVMRKTGRQYPIKKTDHLCTLCNKTFKSKGNLQIHELIHTNRTRDYTCDKCGKTFFNKGTLTSHMLLHDDKRPFKCEICGNGFKTRTQLRGHVGIHGGPRPHACEQCGRCFRLRCQLKSHQIIHTDSMPHTCEYCGKAFRFKTILTQHLRQHTGVKPYSCTQCQRGFTNWPNYNKHMKRRHGIDTAKKKVTPEGVFPIDPHTGLVQIQTELSASNIAEWKSKLMLRYKAGKLARNEIKPKNEPNFVAQSYLDINTVHPEPIETVDEKLISFVGDN